MTASDPGAQVRLKSSMPSRDIKLIAEAIRFQVQKFSDRHLNDSDDIWRERELEYRRAVAETANAIRGALALDPAEFAAACGLYVSNGRDFYSDCCAGELTWEKPSMSAAAPIQYGFEYEVKLAVSIPISWATLLKEAAKHHYDAKCRECGDRGVVNALYNTACDGEFPSNHPVAFLDLNLVSKVAEQLHYHTEDRALVLTIRAWLQDTMEALSKQRELCMRLPGSAEAA